MSKNEDEKRPGSRWFVVAVVCLLAFVFYNLATDLKRMKQQKSQNVTSVPTAEVAQAKKH